MTFADGVSGLIAQEKEGGTQLPLRLLTMMIDDSTSMSFFNNHLVVMDAHNGLLDMLAASERAPLFLARTRYMHGKALANGYCPLHQAPRMTPKNYLLRGGTPLFTATRCVLGYVKHRAKEYAEEGYDVGTLTLLLTDGQDREFGRHNPSVRDARKVVESMIASGRHIVAGVVIANPHFGDFRPVFLEMGIPPQWIITLRSADEIRAAFSSFAQSVESSTIGGQGFAETQAKGFGNASTQT